MGIDLFVNIMTVLATKMGYVGLFIAKYP